MLFFSVAELVVGMNLSVENDCIGKRGGTS